MNALFAATTSAGVFYPLLVGAILVWLGVRALLRRRMGARRWATVVTALERGLLTALILGMIALSMVQIVLRNFFHTGLIWIEPLLRHLVLWIGFSAAVVATGRLRHIHMDVIGRILPPAGRIFVTRVTALVAAVICVVLARASWLFLASEQQFGATGLLDVPIWILTFALFPGFALMAARFTARGLGGRETLQAIAAEREDGGGEAPEAGDQGEAEAAGAAPETGETQTPAEGRAAQRTGRGKQSGEAGGAGPPVREERRDGA